MAVRNNFRLDTAVTTVAPPWVNIQADPGEANRVMCPFGTGRYVLELICTNTSYLITANPRSQVLGPDNIRQGDDLWFGTVVGLPTDFAPGTLPNDFQTLAATYGPPYSGTGPYGFYLNPARDRYLLQYTYYDTIQPAGVHYGGNIWQSPVIAKGQYQVLILHVYFHTVGSQGFLELYYAPTLQSPVAKQTLSVGNLGSRSDGGYFTPDMTRMYGETLLLTASGPSTFHYVANNYRLKDTTMVATHMYFKNNIVADTLAEVLADIGTNTPGPTSRTDADTINDACSSWVAANYAETTGTPSSNGSVYSIGSGVEIKTSPLYDCQNNQITWKFTVASQATGTGVTANLFNAGIVATADNNTRVIFRDYGTDGGARTLALRKTVGGIANPTELTATPPATTYWVRLRFSADAHSVDLMYSSNGSTWTTVGSMDISELALDVNAAKLVAGACGILTGTGTLNAATLDSVVGAVSADAPATPTTPDAPVLADNGATTSSLTFEWTDPGDHPDAYGLYLGADQAGSFVKVGADIVGLSGVVTGLNPNTTYWVRIDAVKSGVRSSLSAAAQGATQQAPQGPPVRHALYEVLAGGNFTGDQGEVVDLLDHTDRAIIALDASGLQIVDNARLLAL